VTIIELLLGLTRQGSHRRVDLTIIEDGQLTLQVPLDIFPSQHRVVVVIDKQYPTVRNRNPFWMDVETALADTGFIVVTHKVGFDVVEDQSSSEVSANFEGG
jgi:hypothetical protein